MPVIKGDENASLFKKIINNLTQMVKKEESPPREALIHELETLNVRGMSGKKLLNYLETEFEYRVITEPAVWGGLLPPGSPFEGAMGHHAMILLPDNRVIEYALPDPGENNVKDPTQLIISQQEIRRATGATIEKMWQNALSLKEKEFYSPAFYHPFKHDCFTFLDRVLEESGEPLSTLSRGPENEQQIVNIVENLSNLKATYSRLLLLFLTAPALLRAEQAPVDVKEADEEKSAAAVAQDQSASEEEQESDVLPLWSSNYL